MIEITNEDKVVFEKYVYRFKTIVVSPLICGSADNRYRDSIIRATEIKGVLRWFLRYILIDKYETSKKRDVLKIIEDIFGGTAKSSFFDIRIKTDNIKYCDEFRLHINTLSKKDYGRRFVHALEKGFICPKSEFTIEFIKKRELEKENLKGKEIELFELFGIIINIFGCGNSIRAGLGKINLVDKKYTNLDDLFDDLREKIKNLFGIEFSYKKIKENADGLIKEINKYSSIERRNREFILVNEITKIDTDNYLEILKHIYNFKKSLRMNKEFNKMKVPIVFSILKNENKLTIYGIVLLKELKIYYNTHKKS